MIPFKTTDGFSHYHCPVCGKMGKNDISHASYRESEFKYVEKFYCSCEDHGLFIIERNQNVDYERRINRRRKSPNVES